MVPNLSKKKLFLFFTFYLFIGKAEKIKFIYLDFFRLKHFPTDPELKMYNVKKTFFKTIKIDF